MNRPEGYHPRVNDALKQRRLALSMQAHQVAEAFGVDRGTWYNWEAGRSKPTPLKSVLVKGFLEGRLIPILTATGWKLHDVETDKPAPGRPLQAPSANSIQALMTRVEAETGSPVFRLTSDKDEDGQGFIIRAELDDGRVYTEKRSAGRLIRTIERPNAEHREVKKDPEKSLTVDIDGSNMDGVDAMPRTTRQGSRKAKLHEDGSQPEAVLIRFSRSQMAEVKAEALAAGLTVAEFVRRRLARKD